jgi:hypothetical protein
MIILAPDPMRRLPGRQVRGRAGRQELRHRGHVLPGVHLMNFRFGRKICGHIFILKFWTKFQFLTTDLHTYSVRLIFMDTNLDLNGHKKQ